METVRPTTDMDLSVLPDQVWIEDQARLVQDADAAGTTDAISALHGDFSAKVVVITTRGAKTGRKRRTPVIRVEHEGRYAAVASKAGAPGNPAWYHNLVAHPEAEVWDGTAKRQYRAREVHDVERDEWWDRAVEAWPSYDDYRLKTSRTIPVLVLEPVK